MKDTGLPAKPAILIRLVKQYATPETLEMIAGAWDTCPPGERLDLVMEAWATYEQEFMIVVITATHTWGLILDTLDDAGDNAEYLSLWNAGTIKHWFE